LDSLIIVVDQHPSSNFFANNVGAGQVPQTSTCWPSWYCGSLYFQPKFLVLAYDSIFFFLVTFL